MKVGELIALLQAMPAEADVEVLDHGYETDDCYEDPSGRPISRVSAPGEAIHYVGSANIVLIE